MESGTERNVNEDGSYTDEFNQEWDSHIKVKEIDYELEHELYKTIIETQVYTSGSVY